MTLPFAARMRPRDVKDFIGQQHLLGEQGPITSMLARGKIESMLLYGPPGTGKTSLAHLIAESVDADIHQLSAIESGVKDIRQVAKQGAEQSLFNKPIILFIDEIHRFNKAQQDALLPYVEQGDVTLIGATTENPAFSVNSALLSRVRIFELYAHNEADLRQLLQTVIDREYTQVNVEDAAISALVDNAQGDARRMLGHFAACMEIHNTNTPLSLQTVQICAGEKARYFDRGGDYFYDMLSAFHKSVRGSQPDASIYWLMRIHQAGCDLAVVARRLLAIATEDVGTADPKAMQVCLNGWDIYHRVGDKEGLRALVEAAVYCALAPKSNAVYLAMQKAQKIINEHPNLPVPSHLCNPVSEFARQQGKGDGYRYAHNEEGGYAANMNFLPVGISDVTFYQPKAIGFEKILIEKMAYLRQRDKQASND